MRISDPGALVKGAAARGFCVRAGTARDAVGMDAVLTPILDRWASARPRGTAHVLSHYVRHPDRVALTLAEDRRGVILGFQSLKRAAPGNAYGLAVGWGLIGTYVASDAVGMGVGQALFASTLRAAREAEMSCIDATIGAQNAEGLAYYGALGFAEWRMLDGAVGKRFRVTR